MSATIFMRTGWACTGEDLLPLQRELGTAVQWVSGEPGDGTTTDPFLAGWSLGGMQAIRSAAQHPPSGLILIASSLRFPDCLPDGSSRIDAIRQGLAHDPKRTLTRFFLESAYPAKPDRREVAQRVESAMAMGRQELLNGLDELASINATRLAGDLACPVLILHGRHDAIIPPEEAGITARACPHADIDIHPDSGHELPVREAAWCASRITEFVNRVTGERHP